MAGKNGKTTKKKRQDEAGRLRRKKGPLAKRLFYWGAVAGLWIAIFAGGYVGFCAYTLPTPQNIREGWETPAVTFTARDGSTLYTIGRRRGEWLESDQIPPVLVDAVLAIEDRRFFEHGPIDLKGIARAAVANVMAGNIVEGGSTITQQLAKNLFLTPKRTFKRKIQEILLAFWLENEYSKEDILAFYLNRVYLGGGTYGVDAASRLYFDHGARDLSVSEAAMLAGLLKAPSRLNPHSDRDAAWARAQTVLDAMAASGRIAAARADKAKIPAVTPPGGPPGGRYFVDWIRRMLEDEVGFTGRDLFVRTTLDPAMQRAAERAVTGRLESAGKERNVGQAALVALAPDGAVRAMVGGRDYAESQYNRAVQAQRQTGSAFKLFVYLTAFEAGLEPTTVMRDSPITLDGWSPKNYDGAHVGRVTLERAFADSINTVAVKLSERVNRRAVIETARDLGVTSDLTPHPSLALGAGEMRPIELTAAYTAVTNGGHLIKPYGIVEVRTADGTQLYRGRAETPPKVLSDRAVMDMRRLLVTALETGTGKAARPGRPAAGKTGTSQDYRDAWFVGFSGNVTAGVWVGNDNDEPMNGVTGGGLPARIWRDFMTAIPDGRPARGLAGSKNRNEAEKPGILEGLFSR